MLASGHIRHRQFGWITSGDSERYESGQRRLGRRWIDAAEDARLHDTIERGWRVRSAHYEVTTNHSLAAGVQLTAHLEQLHQVWWQLMAAYHTDPGKIRRAFSGGRLVPERQSPLQVTYYRTREEYNDALRPVQPRIDITLGIYFDNRRRAYFFAGEAQRDSTLFHEAVHQLFQESQRVRRNPGAESNFWIIEGIAAYFESLALHDGYATLGGADAARMKAARHRLLETGFQVPFADLVRMGKADVQRHPQIAMLYSQMAGQTSFLMHGQQGRYRRRLVRYLMKVYGGDADFATLAQLTGATYRQLDQEYRQFIEESRSE